MKLEDIAIIICGFLVLLALLTLIILLTHFPYQNYLIPALLGTIWLIMVLTLFGIVAVLLRKHSKTKENKEAES